jgi:hypothetical protein
MLPDQVHVKVAAGGGMQGVQNLDEALELIAFIGGCPSLELRGITTEHGTVQASLLHCLTTG